MMCVNCGKITSAVVQAGFDMYDSHYEYLTHAQKNVGLVGSVGCAFDWRSRVQSPPGPATIFRAV